MERSSLPKKRLWLDGCGGSGTVDSDDDKVRHENIPKGTEKRKKLLIRRRRQQGRQAQSGFSFREEDFFFFSRTNTKKGQRGDVFRLF